MMIAACASWTALMAVFTAAPMTGVARWLGSAPRDAQHFARGAAQRTGRGQPFEPSCPQPLAHFGDQLLGLGRSAGGNGGQRAIEHRVTQRRRVDHDHPAALDAYARGREAYALDRDQLHQHRAREDVVQPGGTSGLYTEARSTRSHKEAGRRSMVRSASWRQKEHHDHRRHG
jgi:hypothetical protein